MAVYPRTMELVGRHGARARDLRRRLRQRRAGEVVVDGCRLVADLIRWQLPIHELYLTPERAASADAVAWSQHAAATFMVDDALLASLAPTRSPQGVLAVTAEPAMRRWAADGGLALVLDGVQDPGNVGAIVRSAAALGATAVLLAPGSADPFHPAAVRGSAGAVFLVPVERDIVLAEVADRLLPTGGELWVAADGGSEVAAWQPAAPTALVLGTEGAGVSAAARALARGVVTIPLARAVESLNVAVAAALLVDAWRRTRG